MAGSITRVMMMSDYTVYLISSLLSAVATAITATYMLLLKVPSVMKTRPRLMDVGVVTGLFSGRGMEYIWYHYSVEMGIITFIVYGITILSITKIN